jgi:hypothetical protein
MPFGLFLIFLFSEGTDPAIIRAMSTVLPSDRAPSWRRVRRPTSAGALLGVAACLAAGCSGEFVTHGAGGAGAGAAGQSRPGVAGPSAPGTKGTDPALPGAPQGSLDGPGDGRPRACTAGGEAPVPARLRRLTRREIGASYVRHVSVEEDPRTSGFSTGAERSVTTGYGDALERTARALSGAFRATVAQPAFEAACFAGDAGGRRCAERFIRDFGKTALRRPLEAREVTALLAVYDAGRETGEADAADRFKAGLEWTLRALLQSPHFVYRSELGAAGAPSAALTPHERASALSYALVASPPDAELTRAADAGELATQEQLAAQARRLIGARADRFRAQLRRFVGEWLGIDFDHPEWEKKPEAYPLFSASLKASVKAELELLLDDWIASGAALPRLFDARDGFASQTTAPLYGMTMSTAGPQKMAMPAGERAGILTNPGFLATHAHVDSSSPVMRGMTLLTRVFCQTTPPAPAEVPALPAKDGAATTTTRARFEQHLSSEACASCHRRIDPMGFAFEGYDGLGVHRTHENGVPIDARGAIVGTASSDRSVNGAVEMAQAVAASPDAHACFARQVFRFTMGVRDRDEDACAVERLSAGFAAAGLDTRELLVALVSSDVFTTRLAP